MNEVTGETYSLRSKEDATDYRYMPDPNLPALVIDPVSRLLPEGLSSAKSGLTEIS